MNEKLTASEPNRLVRSRLTIVEMASRSVRNTVLVLLAATVAMAGCTSISDGGKTGSVRQYTGHELQAERIPWYFPDPKVPPPRFPQAHPDAAYKEGMTSREYFDHLCKLEAGEFISRTVEGVEGIYLLRPRFRPREILLTQRRAMEDPFSAVAYDGLYYSVFHRAYTLAVQDGSRLTEGRFVPERSYKFTEKAYLEEKDVFGAESHYKNPLFSAVSDGDDYGHWGKNQYQGDEKLRRATEKQGRYLRYVRNWPIEYKVSPGGRHYPQNGYLIEHRVDKLKSHYGVAWRGIQRPRDREMGIGGGELYVIDLATNEILAYRRGFVLGGKQGDGPVFWRSTAECPKEFIRGRKIDVDNSPKDARNFIERILKPSTSLPEKE
ncbi:MAG: hypothetical protein FD157_4131 [Rhodocyclaceae bacterium]|nr:MAG: hypothetical protein FD157_4131 [Rhodocyclaceae bacterium]TNC99542.1 MAG: hypothetical protein FD118_3661 [Rhodocyclaceae bacterium]